jgi:hypothetical protein
MTRHFCSGSENNYGDRDKKETIFQRLVFNIARSMVALLREVLAAAPALLSKSSLIMPWTYNTPRQDNFSEPSPPLCTIVYLNR